MSVRKLYILLYRDKEKRSIMCLHFEYHVEALKEAAKILSRPDVIAVIYQEWNQAGIIIKQMTIRKTLYIIYPKGRPNSARYETYQRDKAEYIAKYIDGEIEVVKDNYYEMLMRERNKND